MATVYLAHDPRFKRDVAIKVLPSQFMDDPDFRERFELEAQTIAQLEHNAIVPVYDFGEENGQPYLVMRYMRGGTLADRLEKGPMTLSQAAEIIERIASALDAAHEDGIVHRDLKPPNILFSKHGAAFLGDFGIVKLSEAKATLTGSKIIGTPAYMSPEQAKGESGIGPASDIYTLGVILFEMLTGQQPYKADTPMGVAVKHITDPVPDIHEARAALPAEVGKIILKAMAKTPEARYKTAGEMAAELMALSEREIPTRPLPAWKGAGVDVKKPVREAEEKKPDKATPRRTARTPWVTCGVIALALACVGTVFAFGGFTTLLALVGIGANLEETPTPAVAAATEAPPVAANEAGDAIPYESVVQIWAMYKEMGQLELGWTGSGSIISPDGLILTNAHVVLPDRYFPVDRLIVALTTHEDRPPEPAYYAEVLQADDKLDIAVIRVTEDIDGQPVVAEDLNLPYVELGDSDNLRLGDTIVIIGYPGIGGETITLTRGEVSGFTAEVGRGDRAFIKTSATIAGGNSGGLAASQDGALIGIPTQLGYGGDDQFVDCRVLVDTNRDGRVDEDDNCIPTGGFINALRPIKLALPMIEAAQRGEVAISSSDDPVDADIPQGGTTLFADDFSDTSSGWDNETWESGSTLYAGGEYRIEVIPDGLIVWSNAGRNFSDVVISVEARVIAPVGDGGLGVICRYQDYENFYSMEVYENGFYAIYKQQDAETIELSAGLHNEGLVSSSTSEVRAACVGDTLTLAVDGIVLAEAQDTAFTRGDIGLAGITFNVGGIIVGFDNLLVESAK